MKTTLFLTALFISTITFAQTSKKGYNHYQNANTTSSTTTGGKSSIKTYGKLGNHPNISSATDYNSSRSNKSEKSGTRATDYNSSRSNKRGATAPTTDYNSSRSNKSEDSGVKATDYNSSRSNKNG